jgi:hypothetical protein
VNPEIETYLTLLERRLSLLRLLAQEFVDCRKEFIALDLDGMYRRISEQEELCREIERLHPAIQALQETCATQLGLENRSGGRVAESAGWVERLTCVMQELGKEQAKVGRLNQIHAAYLRRCRRTINVLMNFIGSHAMTYARPEELIPPALQAVEKGCQHG